MERPITERKKASDYPQELLDIFDLYVHGDIDRRGFFDRAKKFAVGGVTVMALWESLRHNYAWAQQVPANDSRIKTERVTIQSPQGNGRINALLVRPANATGRLPGILVVHENRGLNPYIEDVARRLGTSNFMALAPDALTTLGGYPGNEEQGNQMFGQIDRAKLDQDWIAAARYLKGRQDSTGKIGAVGFCYGGGVVNMLAVNLGADLAAGVPYYGGQPPAEQVSKIKAPLLIHYGSEDQRINAGWPAFETALRAAGVKYQMHMYEGAQHGFHNDTTPRYDEADAKLSWQRTLDFFNQNVRG
jgi:carboxymethylenebutenolidase